MSWEHNEAKNDLEKLQKSIANTLRENNFSDTLKNSLRVTAHIPEIDYSKIFPRTQSEQIQKLLSEMTQQHIGQVSKLVKTSLELIATSYPDNWRDGEYLSLPDNLDSLIAEGIPLAWTPPRDILEKIFLSESPGNRRKILSDNHKSIVRHGFTVLDSIDSYVLSEYVVFAKKSATAFECGHWEASQALSTNLLDSLLYRIFDEQSRISITSQKNPIDWKEESVGIALVVGAISASYGEYWPKNGDKIPKKYSRNASTHGVSPMQYSKLNALIALMHVVSLLKCTEIDLIKPEDKNI
ncbi:MAG: hypothetical protein U5K77_03605 [Candidatus Saccharibacteria bacterium]|nr:hypothetical protein [Candidatus Saccharibacteria bacterium]